MRRDTILVFFLDGIAKALAAGTTLLLIHLLSVPDYAAITVAQAVVTIVAQTTAGSVNLIYVLSSQSADALHAERGALLGLQACVALTLCGALLVLLGVGLGVSLAAMSLSAAFVSSDFVRTEFQRRLAFRHYAYVELARSAMFALLLLAIIVFGRDFLGAGSALALQATAIWFVSLPLLIRMDLARGISSAKRGLMLAGAFVGPHYRDLLGYLLAIAVFGQLGIFVLKMLGDVTSLATYGSAFRYYSFLLIALGAAQAVLLPTISRVKRKQELFDIYRKQKTLVGLFIPPVFAVSCLAPWFMPLVDSGRYPDAVPTFWILAASSVISFAASPYVFVVMRFARFRYLLLLALAANVASALMYLVLVPPYGAQGAAAATLLSYALLNGMSFFEARRLMRDPTAELPEMSPLITSRIK
jgi:O-antigen/teichoic acid export membrane protein